MSREELKSALLALEPDERQELLREVDDAFEVTDGLDATLDRRMAEVKAGAAAMVPGETILRKINETRARIGLESL